MNSQLTQVVVITGASSGIGETTARLLASKGAKIVAVARRKARLEQLVNEINSAGGQAIALEADVTSFDQMQQVASKAKDHFGRLDVWVNNAGVMPLSPVEMNRHDEWMWMVDVNIKGVLNGVAAAQPLMRAQGSGHFVNISSVAGHIVFPGAAVYCATKFAVRALSEGIRMESDGSIRVTNISPGAIKTELAEHIGVDEVKQAVKAFTDIAIEPQAIADAILFALAQPADVDVNEMIVRPAKQAL
ncbi:SDR family oxidoreductase [Vibrio sp. SM6]|uniref:SDR family oxidoreductase n=1 Tax=Vibrio agarilyticus TaxID=2726741 RepID=A0A7X8YI82_9VIBR|nr:SDR family oxidoreductase [Vibrio agarilyticus]NLS14439.1 SDR family oxidoreductase [Vibrio agarilyticus]